LRILQLIQRPQERGAEIFTCQLSTHLVELGHEVKIVAIFEGVANLPFNGNILTLEASTKNRFFDIPAWKKLAYIVQEFSPELIQANAGDTLKYAVFSKIMYRWKVPIVFRNASEIGKYLNSSIQKKINEYLFRKVDKVISVSVLSKNDIIKQFPFLEKKVEVIPIGLEDETEFELIELLPQNKKHIIHIGGFTFEKNHEGLLQIFQMAKRLNNNIHLHLLGDGPLKDSIEKRVIDLNLKNYVSFYGFVNNPLSYLRAADILVLPSKIEGLPGVLLESMQSKTPVIAYNVGGISEIINEQSGCLIHSGDKKSFAQSIINILQAPNDDQIKCAYELVQSSYNNKDITLKFVNSYKKLVRGKQ
jgi:L-malate glycosyltransferase